MKIGDSGRLKISGIKVGERRRVKKGALAALAKSMDRYGLIHPIVVRDDGVLVAGGRRLEAAKKLGWKSIPATAISKLSDEQLREIELEENIRREGLDSYEASAQRMKEIRVIEAELAEEVSRNRYEKVSGRPKGGNSELGRRLGVGEATVRRAPLRASPGAMYSDRRVRSDCADGPSQRGQIGRGRGGRRWRARGPRRYRRRAQPTQTD